MKIRTGVITAAGLGTRLHPASAVIPKVMFPVIDKPALQWVVEEALDAGLERLVIVVGFGGELIREHFARVEGAWVGRLEFVEQPEQRGLGDAVLCAAEAVGDEPFALLFGDAIFLGPNPTVALIHDAERHGHSVVGVRRVEPEQVSRRGILVPWSVPADPLLLDRWKEKPAPEEAESDLAVMGRCVFEPALFACLRASSEKSTGELELADGVNALLGQAQVGIHMIEAERLDVGNPEDYTRAFLKMGRQRYPGLDVWKSA